MLEHKVSIFIMPFPTVSHKIALETMASGIPILSYNGTTRMSHCDFIYPESLTWKTIQEFLRKLSSLEPDLLQDQSERSRNFFEKNNSFKMLEDYFLNERNFKDVSSVKANIYDKYIAEATAFDIKSIKKYKSIKLFFFNFIMSTFLLIINLFFIRNKRERIAKIANKISKIN